jgi:hypothetical protein
MRSSTGDNTGPSLSPTESRLSTQNGRATKGAQQPRRSVAKELLSLNGVEGDIVEMSACRQ